MKKTTKRNVLVSVALTASLLGLLAMNLNTVLHALLASSATQELEDFDTVNAELSDKVQWFDDYFTIEYLDQKTIAISEPRYWQKNVSYLILGDNKAVIFDSGPGHRDISQVVKSITELPIVAMVSHYHYDHIGNINKFDNQVLAKLQTTSDNVTSANPYVPDQLLFLTSMAEKERLPTPTINPTQTLDEYESIQLGGRELMIIATPGHSRDSIALFDKLNNQLFSGDFIFDFISASHELIGTESAQDYLLSTQKLLTHIDRKTEIYSAHNVTTEVAPYRYQDIADIHAFFTGNSSGFFPTLDNINQRIEVIY